MRYTAEQIRPKRYPKEKPSEMDWVYRIMGSNFEGRAYWGTINYDWKNVKWFIDIPGAPPELKPLAYPEHKPSEDGVYMVHLRTADEWIVGSWLSYRGMIDNWNPKEVDYFIPYRLEPVSDTDELEREDEVSEGNLCKPQPVQLDCRVSDCKHNKKGGYCVIEPMITLEDAGEHTCWSFIKREPEIKACPFCTDKCTVVKSDKTLAWQVRCIDCGYRSEENYDSAEAIRLHNLIAGKE